VFLIAGLLAREWAQGQSTTVVGPYVQNVGTNNATICWATVNGEVTVTPPVGNDTAFREYQMHSVVLRNLKPGIRFLVRTAA
jgi:hypothetical protein